MVIIKFRICIYICWYSFKPFLYKYTTFYKIYYLLLGNNKVYCNEAYKKLCNVSGININRLWHGLNVDIQSFVTFKLVDLFYINVIFNVVINNSGLKAVTTWNNLYGLNLGKKS